MEKLLLLTSSFFVFFLLQSILRLVHDVTLPSSSKDVNQTIIILKFRSKIVREQNTYERYDGKPWWIECNPGSGPGLINANSQPRDTHRHQRPLFTNGRPHCVSCSTNAPAIATPKVSPYWNIRPCTNCTLVATRQRLLLLFSFLFFLSSFFPFFFAGNKSSLGRITAV